MKLKHHALTFAAVCSCAFAAIAHADVIPGTGQPGTTTLGLSNATQLVSAPAGLGHALLLPYFSAQNGNATLLSITNTDLANAKALKVSFRGASNGDSLLEMTVLLAPGDVWNGTLRAGANGVAELVTADPTCTLPKLAAGVPQPLMTGRLNPQWTAAEKANHTREGYVQVINMADIPDTTSAPNPSALLLAIKPVNGAFSCDTAALQAAILQTNHTVESAAAALGFATPTGGLGGKWSIINVPQTTTYSGSMHALRAVNASGADARGNFVLFPPTDVAYAGAIGLVTADPLLRSLSHTAKTALGAPSGPTAAATVQALSLDLPDLSTPYLSGVASGADVALAQAERVTAALSSRFITNEYATDAVIAAVTDWVLSMPARRYSVAMDYAASPSPRRLYSQVPPFGNQYFHDGNTHVNPSNPSQACMTAASQLFADRNAHIKTGGFVFMGPTALTRMCGAVSVVSFNAAPPAASALAASVARYDNGAEAFVNGWGRLGLADSATSLGLPVIGSGLIKATNPVATPGVSGTYGLTAEHWYTR
jgi:hypothetical protein